MMYYGSVAPVVVKDKLILGPSGDDLDVPAYLEARNPENGELIWRWYVTPQKAGDPGLDTWPNLDMAKHGGGMTWQPITYDPALNHIYVTTGNPQPVVAFKNREGANLYTASIVALDADTGKMVWHFQSSPHDTHDWDATQTAVVFDGTIDGQPRKLIAQASRNGHFFVLDRTTGKAIVSSDYVKTNWSARLRRQGTADPEPGETAAGRRRAGHPQPGRRDQLVPAELQPADGALLRQRHARLQRLVHLRRQRQPDGLGRHRPRRLRRTAGAQGHRLQDRQDPLGMPRYGGNSGILTTAGNVLFNAAAGGLGAYNATTGEPLWNARVGGSVTNGPITYELDGLQYVVAGAGSRLVAFVLNP